jgi:hypothetical protein
LNATIAAQQQLYQTLQHLHLESTIDQQLY